MTVESALSFFIAIFIFGITPGPGTFAILARALAQGARSCFPLAFGMVVSDCLYLTAACFGLAAIAANWNELFTAIRIIGAIYLVYLGWKMWRAPVNLDAENPRASKRSITTSFLQGFLISASNPKVILFYIAFLPTFLDITRLGDGDILLAVMLNMSGLILGLMLIASFVGKARGFFKSELAMKRLNRSAGSLMAAAGAYLVSR
ncbi:LysE family translocator [Marinobacterium jannaschii]|uniref:LysE family translocator n=1 Tax=Marinobacterium jannaschii TaxID=64970 RepID=UPI000482A6EE|nr:LysE family translocator [Marinobacterium jannaschii]